MCPKSLWDLALVTKAFCHCDCALGQGTDQTTSESFFQMFLCNSDTRTRCSHHVGEAGIFDKAIVNGSYTKLGTG